VGRGEELSQLLATIASGDRLVLLAGEAGVGKTRLAHEVARILHDRGSITFRGACDETRALVPYSPFLGQLRALLDVARLPAGVDHARHRTYLHHLLSRSEAPLPNVVDPREGREGLFAAVTALLSAGAGSKPVVMLLDDLQWADGASLDLLRHLLSQHDQRLVILGTCREGEPGGRHPQWANVAEPWTVKKIAPLTREGTAAFIAAAVGQENVSAEFANLLHRTTGGNPLEIQEALLAALEAGSVFRESGRWMRRKIGEMVVPRSVRAAICKRVSRLTPEVQEVLREASVLGQSLDCEHLREASGREVGEIEAALRKASETGLIRMSGRVVAFRHVVIRETLYGTLSTRRRTRLHAATGEALAGSAAPAGQVAWHYVRADDPEQALSWYLAAGDRAEAVFAHCDAVCHYRTAVRLAQEVGDRGRESEARARLRGHVAP